MFFILSKIFWLFAAPINFLALLIIAAALLLAFGLTRAGRIVAIVAASYLMLVGVLPTYLLLLRPLEDRFPRPDWPAYVDGILVLSGGVNGSMIASRGVPAMEQTETRLVAAFELARRYPNARLVFTGSSGAFHTSEYTDAYAAKYIFAQMGLAPSRIVFEDRSRNTWESFVFSKELIKPKPDEVWIVATSASHMRRSMEIAASVDWKVLPWPTDYLTMKEGGGGFFAIGDNLRLMSFAIYEWVGLLVYRFTGRAKSVDGR